MVAAVDGCQYAAGMKDEFKGTGVWSFIKMERKGPEEDKVEEKEEGGGSSLPPPPAAKAAEKDCEVCDKGAAPKGRPDYRK